MPAGDSRESLSALQKLFRRLEKIASLELGNEQDGGTILTAVLISEASRRLLKRAEDRAKETGSCPDQKSAVETASFLQANLKRALPPEIYSAFAAPNFQEERSTGALLALIAELRKNSKLLDGFDERFSGYFYQFSCKIARKEALARIQKADKKSSKEDIISFTQLYTPDWVADYLLANTVIPQWTGKAEATADRFEGYRLSGSPEYEDEQVLSSAENLSIIDPACGAGHILLRAFDLFLKIYTLEGRSCEEAADLILMRNLYGCDIDRRALWLCGFALVLKALSCGAKEINTRLNIADASTEKQQEAETSETEIEAGSLACNFTETHPLGRRYSVTITNPPYAGRRLLDRRFKDFLRDNYFPARHDMSAAFLMKAMQLTKSGGKIGFITQSSLLYLPSYAELRRLLLEKNAVETVVELGPRVFPLASGEKINSMLIILKKNRRTAAELSTAAFMDLGEVEDKSGALKRKQFVRQDCSLFMNTETHAFNYKYPSLLAEIFKSKNRLSDYAEVKQGLATGDNKRFLRFAWDVAEDEIGKRWQPYIKGAGGERWHAACRTVVDWGSDGEKIKAAVEESYPYLKGKSAWVVKNESYYFRRGLTFSFVSTGNFAVRRLPEGCIFDVGGSALFCAPENEDFLLAYLNSSFAAVCAEFLNPTFNFQVGDVKRIALPEFSNKLVRELQDLSAEAWELKLALSEWDETKIGYKEPEEITRLLTKSETCLERLWQSYLQRRTKQIKRLAEIERKIDRSIFDTIISTHSLDSALSENLLNLVSRKEKNRKEAAAELNSAADFAAFFLRALLRMKLEKYDFFESDRTLPLSEDLEEEQRIWLEKQVNKPLSDYFIKDFNRSEEIRFLKSPQQICRLAPDEKRLLFYSSKSMRRIQKAVRSPAQTPDETGYKVMSEIIARISHLPDWTGKDLYAASRLY